MSFDEILDLTADVFSFYNKYVPQVSYTKEQDVANVQ